MIQYVISALKSSTGDSMRFVFRDLLISIASVCTAVAVSAQPFPTRPISLSVAYAAGGGTDTFARTFAESLSQRVKQSVVVENTPGAGGTISAIKVMAAKPDGYALAISNGLEFEMQQMAEPTVGPSRTSMLTPIALLGTQPMVLVSRTDLGWKTIDDFVKATKSQPGRISMGSSGPGTSLYLAGSMIEKGGDLKLLRVPYKSGPQIVTDLIAGTLDTAVLALPTAQSFVQNGKLTALAVTDQRRSPILPDVPSLADHAAYKGFDTKVWYALQGPPKLPESIVNMLGENTRAILNDPAFVSKMHALAITPAKEGTAAEFEELKAAQYAAFQRALGIRK
ncbi:UNVERIFIED_ORG: tripartite-type tricarboxylate transporter receptor subunit TctC [Variovorax paradoxus]|nr:tripartite-type tricarboxylate transporter receptor subunit TctC [Variovorax paradoxus]